LYPVRTILANRLSNTALGWSQTIAKYNSGTYNNQWIVFDYKLFTPNQKVPQGALYIVEQIPGYVEMADVTEFLNNQGYWPSYNTPYFVDIFNKSGYGEMVAKQGNAFSYSANPRANIFRRDQNTVNSIQSMQHMMRENDYLHDPLSLGDPGNAISSRFDLERWGNNSFPFGGLDSKFTNSRMMSNFSCIAVSGPTWQSLPPFSWSGEWGFVPHPGQPELWKFDWVTIDRTTFQKKN